MWSLNRELELLPAACRCGRRFAQFPTARPDDGRYASLPRSLVSTAAGALYIFRSHGNTIAARDVIRSVSSLSGDALYSPDLVSVGVLIRLVVVLGLQFAPLSVRLPLRRRLQPRPRCCTPPPLSAIASDCVVCLVEQYHLWGEAGGGRGAEVPIVPVAIES